jgi:hypothetical protein
MRQIRNAVLGLIAISVLALSSGCSAWNRPLLRHQAVEVVRLEYVEVPEALTRETRLPALSPLRKNRDMEAELEATREALRQANFDKARIAEIEGKPVAPVVPADDR